MAKKKTSGKTKSFSEAIGLQYIFNNTITDFFLGLALLVVAVVMILAMISSVRALPTRACWSTCSPENGPTPSSCSRTTADPWEPSSPIG